MGDSPSSRISTLPTRTRVFRARQRQRHFARSKCGLDRRPQAGLLAFLKLITDNPTFCDKAFLEAPRDSRGKLVFDTQARVCRQDSILEDGDGTTELCRYERVYCRGIRRQFSDLDAAREKSLRTYMAILFFFASQVSFCKPQVKAMAKKEEFRRKQSSLVCGAPHSKAQLCIALRR